MRHHHLIGGALAGAIAAFAGASEAQAGCTDGTTFVQSVDRTFSTGARWQFSVYHDNCSGIRLSAVQYTAPGDVARTVLNSAKIAEIHVPYDKGSPRFLDLSVSTSGLGANAVTLSAAECPGGTLIDANRICLRNDDGHDYAWKTNGAFKLQESVMVQMSSQLGNYNYVNQFVFRMDGTIEANLGLTGSLHTTFTANSANIAAAKEFGSQLNPEAAASKLIGLNHVHAAYYRLDFDIDGAANDVVSRSSVAGFIGTAVDGNNCDETGECQKTTFTPITTETSQTWSASGHTTWLVQDKTSLNADGRRRGYEVIPHVSGTWRGITGSSEPWSGADAWITAFNSCELLAVGNVGAAIPSTCPSTTGQNVQQYLNGQTVDGADVVLWYVQRFHHNTRDEDGCGGGQADCTDVKMPLEYVSFEMAPRSFSHKSTIP